MNYQMAFWLVRDLPLYLATAIGTHLIISLGQTLMHWKFGHAPMGGQLFRNHISFHHRYYSKDHLVSRTYVGDEGNNTPYFLIPIFFIEVCAYLLLPLDLFVVQALACAASFYAHVYFDKEYHVEGSKLGRFEWFRRKQALHFVHHRHTGCNYAVIDFFWDQMLGTYRAPDRTPATHSPEMRPIGRARSSEGDATASDRFQISVESSGSSEIRR